MGKGINKETRGASLKKIVPNPEVNNGLVLATLESVQKASADITEQSSYVDFRGKTVPRLTFVFVEKVADKNTEPGSYFHSYTAFPDIYNDENDWKWDQMAQTIKHFIDVLGTEFKDEYVELLEIGIEEGKDYTVEEQIEAWSKFVDGVVKVFEGDKNAGLPKLTGKDVWMKLLMSVKGKLVDRGNYALPGYPGEGTIELYDANKLPNIRINISKGESIQQKEYNEPTNLGSPSTDPVSAGAGSNMPSFMQK